MKFATKLFYYIFISTALIISGMIIVTHIWILNLHMKMHIRSAKELAMLAALKSEDYILRNDRVELYRFFESIIKVNPYIQYFFAEKQGEIQVHTFEKGVPRGLLRLSPIKTPYLVDITPITNNQGNLIYHFRIGISTPPHTFLHFGVSDRKIRGELEGLRYLMLIFGGIMLLTLPIGLAWFLSRMVSPGRCPFCAMALNASAAENWIYI